MIDHSIILLIGRMVSRGEKRVRFSVIIEQLERLGMILDDTTRERIVADLEQKGLLQSLSDSGEAVYVQVY
jgi:DNA phosphorothioation-dependent restriction protein DptG